MSFRNVLEFTPCKLQYISERILFTDSDESTPRKLYLHNVCRHTGLLCLSDDKQNVPFGGYPVVKVFRGHWLSFHIEGQTQESADTFAVSHVKHKQ